MIILDTHVWIWWASDPKRLTKAAARAIDRAEVIGMCAITGWELAMLVNYRRIEFDRDVLTWIRDCLLLPRATWIDLTPEIAVTAGGLGAGFHGDPADRLIVASAANTHATLISKDERIHSHAPVPVIW